MIFKGRFCITYIGLDLLFPTVYSLSPYLSPSCVSVSTLSLSPCQVGEEEGMNKINKKATLMHYCLFPKRIEKQRHVDVAAGASVPRDTLEPNSQNILNFLPICGQLYDQYFFFYSLDKTFLTMWLNLISRTLVQDRRMCCTGFTNPFFLFF